MNHASKYMITSIGTIARNKELNAEQRKGWTWPSKRRKFKTMDDNEDKSTRKKKKLPQVKTKKKKVKRGRRWQIS